MPNALIPRHTVHAWSEQIGNDAHNHQSSLQRLIKDQRRLTRFIEENQAEMNPVTAGVAVYMTGVIARMFDLAGGRLKGATWAQVREAEARVAAHLDALLPLDDGLPGRLHAIADRAQPHILDEAAMVLFEREPGEEEEALDKKESLKVLLMSWVVIEVLDANWRPPAGFQGESTYAHVHIDPTPSAAAAAAESDGAVSDATP
jgi:hypothetical protein